MPTVYQRDDERRLITVKITEPYSVEEIISVIDRQMAEDAWEYAMLYDMRATTRLSTLDETRQVAGHIQTLSGGRRRGPVALVISAGPEQVEAGLEFAKLNREVALPDLLLTAMQLDDWVARNAPRREVEEP